MKIKSLIIKINDNNLKLPEDSEIPSLFILIDKKKKISGNSKILKNNLLLFVPKEKIPKINSKNISIKIGKLPIKAEIFLILDEDLFSRKKKVLKKVEENFNKNKVELISLLKGKNGVSEDFLKLNLLNKKSLKKTLFELELMGKILILSLYPIFFIEKNSLKNIIKKVYEYIKRKEYKKGIKYGVKVDELISQLEIKNKKLEKFVFFKLLKEEKIEIYGERVFSKSDILTKEEEKIIKKIENIIIKSKYESINIENISKTLKIEKKLVEKYIDILFEDKKVLPIKEGFYIHKEMIDEIIKKLRKLKVRKPYFAVKDFKEITGLSRKYTIPILELLDYLHITRRIGNKREILI